VRVTATSALVGQRLEPATVERAVAAIDDEIAPEDDPHVSAAYRRRVARVLLTRAVLEARDHALGAASPAP
jgi:CO/xanthine dehydrogenase FAD-binding subunit